MQLNIPSEVESYLDSQVKSGAYESREAVIIDAIVLLRERLEFIASLDEAEAEFAAGRSVSIDVAKDWFEQKKTELLNHVE